MLLVVSTRHGYEITPQPTATHVLLLERQRDIDTLLELTGALTCQGIKRQLVYIDDGVY